jgi:hypothetical protein
LYLSRKALLFSRTTCLILLHLKFAGLASVLKFPCAVLRGSVLLNVSTIPGGGKIRDPPY